MMGLPSDGTATTMAISTLPEGLRRFRKNRELDSTITRRGCYERVSEGFGLLSANLGAPPTPRAACRSGGARCAGSSGPHPAHGAQAGADRFSSAAPRCTSGLSPRFGRFCLSRVRSSAPAKKRILLQTLKNTGQDALKRAPITATSPEPFRSGLAT